VKVHVQRPSSRVSPWLPLLYPSIRPHTQTGILGALFETDKRKIPERIAEAERALICREHELFTGTKNKFEREAVNTALHSLHALRSCLDHRPHGIAA
jgi:hypothetical protein